MHGANVGVNAARGTARPADSQFTGRVLGLRGIICTL
jgi:hypothetical protein